MNDTPLDTVVPEADIVQPDETTNPEASGALITKEEQIQQLQFTADNIEQAIAAHIKIRTAILKLAQPGDWVLWGKSAEIGFAGANRIGSTLGVTFSNWSSEKLSGTDEHGDWYRWEYSCDASFHGRAVRVYGRAGSRDILFGYENKQWKKLANVNEGNIKVAAMRSAKKEGVKDLFGLHHLDPEFLKANHINLASAGGFEHKDKEAKAADIKTVTVVIVDVTSKATDKWTKYSIKDAEGVVYGTFSKTIAEEAKLAKTTGTPAKIDFTVDAKYGPNAVSVNGIVSSKGD